MNEKKSNSICFSVIQDQKALDEKEKQSTGVQALYDKLRQEDEKCEENLKDAQRRYEDISMGKFTTEVILRVLGQLIVGLFIPVLFLARPLLSKKFCSFNSGKC